MSGKSLAELILDDVRRMQSELGRFPSRDQYLDGGGKYPKSVIAEVFGSWTKMLLANGIQYSVKGKRDKQEIREQVFNQLRRDVEAKRLVVPPQISRNLLVVPDIHAPYHHPDAMEFLAAIHAKHKFDRVILTGDEIDGHAWSFHDKNPDALSPGHELEAAIRALEPLYKLFPKVDIAESNHGSLIARKAKHHGIPMHVIKPYREVLCAPEGWAWHFEIKAQLSTGKSVLVHHAYSSNVLRASQQRGISCIFGHHHSQLSIQYWKNYDDWFFAAFAGSLVDETALAMEYGKNIMNRPMLGALRVTDGVPVIMPMLLDARGRWTGFVP